MVLHDFGTRCHLGGKRSRGSDGASPSRNHERPFSHFATRPVLGSMVSLRFSSSFVQKTKPLNISSNV